MKSILFIDDEPLVLQGLALLLRRERNAWKMVFVQSGEAAVAALEREHFDAVVSDMRMPGMDGAQLLEHVSTRYPSIIRFLLTGQADASMLARAQQVTHHFLSKPCNAAELRESLRGALEGASASLR